MIKLTIDALRTAASRKVNTKVSCALALHLISFCEACVNFRLQFVEGDRTLFILICISISQVLVIPNVVIIISLNIGGFLF